MKRWIKQIASALMIILGVLLAISYSVKADDQVKMDYTGSSEVNSAKSMPFTFTIPQGLAKTDSQIILHIDKDAVEPGTDSIKFTDTDTNVVRMEPIDNNGNVVITLGKGVESLIEYPLKVSLLIKPSSQVGLDKGKPYKANVTAKFVPKDGNAIALNSGNPFTININNYAGGDSGDANFSVVNFGMDRNNPLKFPDAFKETDGNKYIPNYYAQNGDQYQFDYTGNYMTGYTQVQFPKLAAGESLSDVKLNVDTSQSIYPESIKLFDYTNTAVPTDYYKVVTTDTGFTIDFSGWPKDKPINGLSAIYAVKTQSANDKVKVTSSATITTSLDRTLKQDGNSAAFAFINNSNGEFIPSLVLKPDGYTISQGQNYVPKGSDFVTKAFDPDHDSFKVGEGTYTIKVNGDLSNPGTHKVDIIFTNNKTQISSRTYTSKLQVVPQTDTQEISVQYIYWTNGQDIKKLTVGNGLPIVKENLGSGNLDLTQFKTIPSGVADASQYQFVGFGTIVNDKFTELPDQSNLKYKNGVQNVVALFNKPNKAVQVTLIPYDEATNKPITGMSSHVINGQPGNKISIPDINGWTFDTKNSKNPSNPFEIPDKDAKIPVYYKKNQPTSVSAILIPCDKTTGKKIPNVESTSITAVPGSKIEVPTLAGWTPVNAVPSTMPANGGDIKVYYQPNLPDQPNNVTVTIIPYDRATNKPIPNVSPLKMNAEPGEKVAMPEITGYNPESTSPITIPAGGGTIKEYYTKKSSTNGGGTTPTNGGSTPTTNNSSTSPTANNGSSSSQSTSSTSTQPVSPQPSNPQASGSLVATRGEAVYSLKPIYLYESKNFNSHERLAKYTKKPRVNRPMFVVIRYARDANGRLRYFVRDVNHLSKTDGKTGYITANTSYVRPVYYRSLHKVITVINPNGVNSYRTKKLTGFVKHYRQGTILKVSRIVTHNLTTRYVLTNGKIITANRKLVKSGKTSFPKKITVKKGIKLYSTLNSKSSRQHIKAGKKLQVKKVVYTVPSSVTQSGTKRYQVAGGYVTANSKYVKITK